GDELLHLRLSALVDGHAHHTEPLLRVLVVKRLKLRHRPTAGHAPRGPEVEQHELALEALVRDGVAGKAFQRERRRRARERRLDVSRGVRFERLRALLRTEAVLLALVGPYRLDRLLLRIAPRHLADETRGLGWRGRHVFRWQSRDE